MKRYAELIRISKYQNYKIKNLQDNKIADFKFTSQANHMSKLLSLRTEVRRQAFHMQRLYKRRKTDDDGYIKSNWSVLREVSALDD